MTPNAAVTGMLVNPNLPDAGSQWKDVQEAARMIGKEVHVVHAGSEGDFSRAFATPALALRDSPLRQRSMFRKLKQISSQPST